MAFLLSKSKKEEPEQGAPTQSEEAPPEGKQQCCSIKVVLVGKDGIGMKPRMQRALRDKKPVEQKTTIGIDFVLRTKVIDGVLVKTHIWGLLMSVRPHKTKKQRQHTAQHTNRHGR